ncbi:MAG: mechanosensitive ion channel family protein [Luteolibacter sp.]
MNPETISDWLQQLKLDANLADLLGVGTSMIIVIILAFIANLAAKVMIRRLIHPIIRKTSTQLDDKLVEHGMIIRASHLVPALVIHSLTLILFENHNTVKQISALTVNVYLIICVLMVIDAAINFARATWEASKLGIRFPAKSFSQAAKLVINLIGLIFILANILGKSPLVLFSGLGAVTAILLLVFKDAILGLVAGFQLSLNNMVCVGDWIEMPGRGADGDVLDVSLTTVKVQNWDKTITTIPTYALISDSFKNWRGMSESGGRRIKRSIHIDMRTIRFADDEMLKTFKGIRILKSYLQSKLEDIRGYNEDIPDDISELINGRRLTNIGTFRAYCVAYLKNHTKIHQNMTLLVRQLAPTPHGLPIEIYVFSNDTAWVNYEDVQGDIFDHFLSVLPEFGLSTYQVPSGADIEKAGLKIG